MALGPFHNQLYHRQNKYFRINRKFIYSYQNNLDWISDPYIDMCQYSLCNSEKIDVNNSKILHNLPKALFHILAFK